VKRLTVLSDLHCGHLVGLTHPDWQLTGKDGSPVGKVAAAQSALWDQFATLKKRKTDILIVNGDLIDGSGKRSGGTECITTDMLAQAEMAAEAIKAVIHKNTKVYIVRGTPYHTGQDSDFENVVAQHLGASHRVRIKDHLYLSIEGWLFDVKHKVGSSGVPYGRHTAVAKESLWAKLWVQEFEDHPQSDVIIRSHVHYFNGSFGPDFIGLTTPALQGLGSKYGARQCSGIVNWGWVEFDVQKNVRPWPDAKIFKIKEQQPEVLEA